ncbi:hypothetical protein NPIL_121121 [Nephila pilipes]|uniref:Uncharacterized protein n=1 Tax=Nephila pilipes TaxID=299642 RepID=A0A8X6IZ46_NEPPI|nr:hypothetical protein NPIL_121121 [Nephila pilipes]
MCLILFRIIVHPFSSSRRSGGKNKSFGKIGVEWNGIVACFFTARYRGSRRTGSVLSKTGGQNEAEAAVAQRARLYSEAKRLLLAMDHFQFKPQSRDTPSRGLGISTYLTCISPSSQQALVALGLNPTIQRKQRRP